MKQSIENIQEEIVEDFAFFTDWTEKYEYIIALGKDLEEMPTQWKTEEFQIRGCQSQLWIKEELQNDGSLRFYADSDAIITKGLAALLISPFQGQKPEQISTASMDFVQKIDLVSNLSMTRANGLQSMMQTILIKGKQHSNNSII